MDRRHQSTSWTIVCSRFTNCRLTSVNLLLTLTITLLLNSTQQWTFNWYCHLRIHINSHETCCFTVCAIWGCTWHTAVSPWHRYAFPPRHRPLTVSHFSDERVCSYRFVSVLYKINTADRMHASKGKRLEHQSARTSKIANGGLLGSPSLVTNVQIGNW